MRRGSLVGPLLLVLIGALFLANNLRPELPLLDIIARYWPFVLIGWGLLRLIEIFYWVATSRPLPLNGISAGEWVLVVFLCLIGSGLYVANVHRPWEQFGPIRIKTLEAFGENYDYPVGERKQPAGKAPRILVENLRGNARIIGADVKEVTVSGRKSVRAFRQADADVADKQSPVEVSAQGDQIVVRTNQERAGSDRRISTDLDLTVPRGASIEGRGREGDFEISDLAGNVEISSDNAGVRIQSVGGNVRVDLRRSDVVRAVNVKGSVAVVGGRGQDLEFENVEGPVTVDGSFSGELQFRNLGRPMRFQTGVTDLRVEKVAGHIRMDLGDFSAAGLVGPVRLVTRSKDVEIEDFTQPLEVSLERGDIHLRPIKLPLARMEAKTHSGNVELALPEAARFVLVAETARGEVNNDFGPALREEGLGPEPRREHERRNRGGALRGSTGAGPEIRLLTDRGKIIVRKDTGAPARPEPPRPPKPPDKPDLPVKSL